MGADKIHQKAIWKSPKTVIVVVCFVASLVAIVILALYISSLNSEVIDLNTQIRDQSGQISNLNYNLSSTQIAFNLLQMNYANYSESHTHNDSEYANLQTIYSLQIAQINSLNNAVLNLTSQVADLNTYASSHTHNDTDFNSLQLNFSSLQTSQANIQTDYSNLQANYTDLKTAYMTLNNDHNLLSNYVNTINVTFGANNTFLNASEIQNFASITNNLTVYIADSDFTGIRTLQWISMRNSSNAPWDNYYQKTMEFLLFQPGQGANGEWDAVVSIYNRPNSTSEYVVEVSRFTWHEIQIKLDGNVIIDFPRVTSDISSSTSTFLGYATFSVKV